MGEGSCSQQPQKPQTPGNKLKSSVQGSRETPPPGSAGSPPCRATAQSLGGDLSPKMLTVPVSINRLNAVTKNIRKPLPLEKILKFNWKNNHVNTIGNIWGEFRGELTLPYIKAYCKAVRFKTVWQSYKKDRDEWSQEKHPLTHLQMELCDEGSM